MVSNCLKPQRVFCGGVDRTSGAATRKWSDPCVGFYGFINSAVSTLREGCDSTVLLIGVLLIVLEIFSNYVRFVQKIWLND